MTYIDLVNSGVRLALEKPVDCSLQAMVPWSRDTHIYTAPKKFEPKVFDGTTNGKVFAREMQQHLDTLTDILNYQKVLIWLSYMRGSKVRDWAKRMQYVAGMRISQDVWDGYNDPTILPWFKRAFKLGYEHTLEERSALKELLKLQMKKGDVKTYIKKSKALRRSVMTVRLGQSFSFTYSPPPPFFFLLYYGYSPFAPCNSLELDLPSDTKARTRCLADRAPPSPIYYMPYPRLYCTTYACISTC